MKLLRVNASGLASNPVIAHLTSSRWVITPSPVPSPGNDNELTSVAVVSTTNVWAAGYIRPFASGSMDYQPFVEHFDGKSWQVVSLPAGVSGALFGIAATQNTVWIVGGADGSVLLEYAQSSWKVAPANAAYGYCIVALSDTDVWAAGYGIVHFDGTNWTSTSVALPKSGSAMFSGIAAVPGAGDTLWVVGTALTGENSRTTLIEEYS